jgi:hypothetical protein
VERTHPGVARDEGRRRREGVGDWVSEEAVPRRRRVWPGLAATADGGREPPSVAPVVGFLSPSLRDSDLTGCTGWACCLDAKAQAESRSWAVPLADGPARGSQWANAHLPCPTRFASISFVVPIYLPEEFIHLPL